MQCEEEEPVEVEIEVAVDDVESELSDPEEPPTFEPGGHLVQQQHEHFWEVEKNARLLNAAMTPYEAYSLKNLHMQNYAFRCTAQDARKVIQFFGQSHGAGAASRRLLKELAISHNLQIGDQVAVTSPMWTLCKHLLLQDRATEPNVVEDDKCMGCSCISASYFMVQGCKHQGVAVWKDIFLPTTLCNICSKCLRCGLFPNWTSLCIAHAYAFPNICCSPMGTDCGPKAVQSCCPQAWGQVGLQAEADRPSGVQVPFHSWPFWFQLEALSLCSLEMNSLKETACRKFAGFVAIGAMCTLG